MVWYYFLDAEGRVDRALHPRPSVDVGPVDGNPGLEDRTTPSPTKPVNERDAPPGGLHEVCGEQS